MTYEHNKTSLRSRFIVAITPDSYMELGSCRLSGYTGFLHNRVHVPTLRLSQAYNIKSFLLKSVGWEIHRGYARRHFSTTKSTVNYCLRRIYEQLKQILMFVNYDLTKALLEKLNSIYEFQTTCTFCCELIVDLNTLFVLFFLQFFKIIFLQY